MKIALLGYGKMGKEVEAAAREMGHSVAGKFHGDRMISPDTLRESGADVVIDFTQPSAVLTNVRVCAKAGIPIVIGTTGWDTEREKVKAMVAESGIGCIAGANFSVGVNLFLEIVRNAARLISAANYDVYITEAHHRTKKDFPSGTALRLSEAVLAGMKSKSRVASGLKQGEGVAADTLVVSSVRAGVITGTHTVGFDSEEDSIELTHTAKSRKGFATGSIRAAEWILKRKGYFTFEEHIADILEMRR
jgi:4-hydroxy-tetrahydrodipicolinate reductase